ncbi:HD-GYP domain-containing protein [Desulfobaculum bizertense]|uniref:HD domain-containing protein n=1 Tax=Desulfobaculum bizertense DSM 18034 TaxID=1121442 RepID=A0A1T4X172_9BACT|nr:HD domain-containing phosphohydrolase [Desulfobaculum bizertense]UIJ37190.1 HD domain-containing protein [Desulfobaculum bizertense]SKA83187.1 HD domain-containing protein [Desulfobaculum bizertense DSM 18034]
MASRMSEPSFTAPEVRFYKLVSGVSAVLDLMSPVIAGHHNRTAYFAGRLADVMGLGEKEQADLVLAALLHDVGAFTLDTRLNTLAFDSDDVEHMETGYQLLQIYDSFWNIAEIIHYHHVKYSDFGHVAAHPRHLWLANLLQLADRIDVLVPRSESGDFDRKAAREIVLAEKSTRFAAEFCDAFEKVWKDDAFWDGVFREDRFEELTQRISARDHMMEFHELMDSSRLIAHLVDFRSPFTATHSWGVAAVSEALGRACGMSRKTSECLRLAGYLHDVGKLGIPSELLEKPGKLTDKEFVTMKGHAYYSNSVLTGVPGLAEIARWGAQHHERLDGSGYPFQLDSRNLDQGSRIVAVADVFTAITEDRPYREGMDRYQAMDVLTDLGTTGALDSSVVKSLGDRFEELNHHRQLAQRAARDEFDRFSKRVAEARESRHDN